MRPKRTIFRDLRDDVKLSTRFWAKVAIGEPDACWPWTACGDRHGYGNIRIAGRSYLAHRIAWELTYGPIPDDLRVLHSCDFPPCCNPGHLHPDTQGQNVQEMWDRNPERKRTPPPITYRH